MAESKPCDRSSMKYSVLVINYDSFRQTRRRHGERSSVARLTECAEAMKNVMSWITAGCWLRESLIKRMQPCVSKSFRWRVGCLPLVVEHLVVAGGVRLQRKR